MLFELDVHRDERGWLVESYHRARYAEHGIDLALVQDNLSWSKRGVVRGLHYSRGRTQGKLVHVAYGTVFDVAVDLRRGSATFGRWHGTELSSDNHRQHWIPPGFGHGFAVTSEAAAVLYKMSAPYAAGDDDGAVRWNDPDLAIAWPITGAPVLSLRDQSAPLLRDAALPVYAP
jgi:dTDP-4-dehydrorhamnose 3,5-epimerase